MPLPTQPFRDEHAALRDHIEHLRVHFQEEEDIQLPAFDTNPEVSARVVERMGAHEHQH